MTNLAELKGLAEPSEEQRALRDTASAFLAEHDNIRAADEGDLALWQKMVELGWAAVIVPEQHDGLGLGYADLAVLAEEFGRTLNRSPFFASVVLAQGCLIEAGSAAAQARWLPDLAMGTATATLIGANGLHWQGADALPVAATATGDGGWRLQGRVAQVLDGARADFALVIARLGDGRPAIFHVPADTPGLIRQALPVWDLGRPQAAWDFDGVCLPAESCVDVEVDSATLAERLQRVHALAALMLAAEQIGSSAHCLDITLAYVKERRQFGRPIAEFQAVKHRCAEMMVSIEAARSALAGALPFAAADAATADLMLAAASARIAACEAQRFCAQEAIQLHGGVGFTWEYDPQLHFKRSQWAAHWLGDVAYWRGVVADAVLGVAK